MTDAAIAPTAERVRKLLRVDPGRIDRPEVDQKRARKAWRLVPLVEAMFRARDIDRKQQHAYEMFERDFDTAHREPCCIAKYGRSATNGTPIGQMMQIAMERAEFRDVKRANAAGRVRDAMLAISTERCRRALLMAVTQDTDLVMIGRTLAGYLGKAQARASGTILLQEALSALHEHYDPGD